MSEIFFYSDEISCYMSINERLIPLIFVSVVKGLKATFSTSQSHCKCLQKKYKRKLKIFLSTKKSLHQQQQSQRRRRRKRKQSKVNQADLFYRIPNQNLLTTESKSLSKSRQRGKQKLQQKKESRLRLL